MLSYCDSRLSLYLSLSEQFRDRSPEHSSRFPDANGVVLSKPHGDRAMKASSIEFKLLRNQRGVSAVIIALLLVVLLGMAALAVDLGYLYVTRNELQNVADAAALAATRQLGEIYQAMPGNLQADYDPGRTSTGRPDRYGKDRH